jgi:hypothetical protein
MTGPNLLTTIDWKRPDTFNINMYTKDFSGPFYNIPEKKANVMSARNKRGKV